MKKFYCFMMALFIFVSNSYAQGTTNIHVNTPGLLGEKITSAGLSNSAVTNLCITGSLNDADLSLIATSLTNLKYLDISQIDNTILPDRWLSGNKLITEISLPNNLLSIPISCFQDCSNLSKVVIPNSVETIKKDAFWKCANLKNIFISDLKAWFMIHFDGWSACPLNSHGNLYLNGNLVSTVNIPNGITEIKQYVFDNAQITSVNIPSSVKKISISAFYGCNKLKNVVMANSVESIERLAFKDCAALTDITLSSSLTNISDNAFLNCSAISKVNVSDIAFLCVNAFNDNPLKPGSALYIDGIKIDSLVIPEGVKNLEANFNNLPVTSITLPKSLTSIKNNAFSSNIKNVYCAATVPPATSANFSNINLNTSILYVNAASLSQYKSAAGWSNFSTIKVMDGKTIDVKPSNASMGYTVGSGTYKENTSIEIKAIANNGYCFSRWSDGNKENPRVVVVKTDKTYIAEFNRLQCGPNVFWELDANGKLTISGTGNMWNFTSEKDVPWNKLIDDIYSVEIMNGVTNISNYAFANCKNLKSISIPNGLKSMGNYVFNNCKSLNSISVNSTNPPTVYENTFTGVAKIYVDLVIPANSEQAYLNDIYWKQFLVNLSGKCGDNLTWMATKEKNIIIEGSGDMWDWDNDGNNNAPWFDIVDNISSITISNNATSIGDHAFEKCDMVTSIVIPANINKIGKNAFFGCKKISSLNIPSNVTKIGNDAFADCKALKSVIFNAKNCIADSLEGEIDNNLFGIKYQDGKNTAKHITAIAFGNNVEKIPNFLCYDMELIDTVKIPMSVKVIGKNSFHGCDKFVEITVPDNVVEIEDFAYSECRRLRRVNLGNSIEFLGDDIFSNCMGIYSLKITTMLAPITKNNTFAGISETAWVWIPCGGMPIYMASKNWNKFGSNLQEIEHKVNVKVNDKNMGRAYIDKPATCRDDRCIVTAEAKEGYRFRKWSDDYPQSSHMINVYSDTTITAIFEPYSRSLIALSENDKMGRVKVSIAAEPYEGYKFVRWSDGDETRERSMYLTEDLEIYAHFEPVGVSVEQVSENDINIYSKDGVLFIESIDDYQIFNAAGKLIYFGKDNYITLAKGVYLIKMGEEVRKVVL